MLNREEQLALGKYLVRETQRLTGWVQLKSHQRKHFAVDGISAANSKKSMLRYLASTTVPLK
jgi:hypothetical protein